MPTKIKKIQLREPEKRFLKLFIDIAFENMAIENEAPFSRRAAYRRYRDDALDLIKDGTYKAVKF